jgi:hypothetical protein
MSADRLALTAYWSLPETGRIPSLSLRLEAVMEGRDPGPAEMDPPADLEACRDAVAQRKERLGLPHRERLEAELGQDLSWMGARTGETTAMDMVGEDWLLIGRTAFFSDQKPPYEQVRDAAVEAVRRRKQVESD